MENIASTWYNDLKGTIALDESNFCSFKDFCKEFCKLKIPQDQKPIGIDMTICDAHGHAGFYLNIICRDTKNNYFRYDVEDANGVNLLNLFRRVHIVMFKRFEEPDIDINDLEPIYKE